MANRHFTHRALFGRIPLAAVAMTLLPTVTIMAQESATATADAGTSPEAEFAATQVSGLHARALNALQSDDRETAIAAADAMVRLNPDDPRTTRIAAGIYLRSGKAKWAMRLYDRFLESKPEEMPQLWQRGIALYFMRDFKGGAEQFEQHQKVNPNDVENAAWHFLCVAKLYSPAEAKKRILAAPNDPRIPMEEIRRMLIHGDTAAVTKRVNETPENSKARESAAFFGNFYLGLYADALGDTQKAQSLLKLAAKNAPHNYMGDVARVYAQWISEGDL